MQGIMVGSITHGPALTRHFPDSGLCKRLEESKQVFVWQSILMRLPIRHSSLLIKGDTSVVRYALHLQAEQTTPLFLSLVQAA